MVTTTTPDDLMTIRELQAWLGCGRSKAYELIRTGQIRCYRVGRLLRIRRQDVEAWLDSNQYRSDH